MTTARDLTKQLADLLRREHAAMADFLVALADFDRRHIWMELGHASLFSFLHRELGLSAGAAQYRKTAAELVQRFPEVVAPLRDGRLCITTIVEVAKVLTLENRGHVLPRFFGLSRREAQAVAVAIKPAEAAPHREIVTVARAAPPSIAPALTLLSRDPRARPDERETPSHSFQPVEMSRCTQGGLHAPLAGTGRGKGHDEDMRPPPGAPVPPVPALRDSAEPLTAELSRLHVTVSRGFLEKLERAKDALSHSRPGASAEEILEAGLDLVLAQQAKRRALVQKPRTLSRPRKADGVPAHVKRAVWSRDEGRCQWRVESGGTCGSTLRVELDHVVPRARGGPSTVENLRVLCRFHNDLAARQELGDGWMDRFTRNRPAAAPPSGGATSLGRADPSRAPPQPRRDPADLHAERWSPRDVGSRSRSEPHAEPPGGVRRVRGDARSTRIIGHAPLAGPF